MLLSCYGETNLIPEPAFSVCFNCELVIHSACFCLCKRLLKSCYSKNMLFVGVLDI